MDIELSRKCESLESDMIRDYLFKLAYEFANTCLDDWDWFLMNNSGKLFFLDFVDYIDDERPELLNEIIEAELEYSSNKISKEEFNEKIIKLESLDNYYLSNICFGYRTYINKSLN